MSDERGAWEGDDGVERFVSRDEELEERYVKRYSLCVCAKSCDITQPRDGDGRRVLDERGMG